MTVSYYQLKFHAILMKNVGNNELLVRKNGKNSISRKSDFIVNIVPFQRKPNFYYKLLVSNMNNYEKNI